MGTPFGCKIGLHSWEEKEKHDVCKFCGTKRILDFNRKKWWKPGDSGTGA